jgi:hypothetical protein
VTFPQQKKKQKKKEVQSTFPFWKKEQKEIVNYKQNKQHPPKKRRKEGTNGPCSHNEDLTQLESLSFFHLVLVEEYT